MAGEYSSGARLEVGSRIRGYEIRRVFDPGQFASAAEAVTQDGRSVFLKKYKHPGMYSAWYDDFLGHQLELRSRIASDVVARSLCDEFVECFSHEKTEPAGRKRAIYVIYGMLESARDLAGHLASAVPLDEGELRRRLTFGRVLVAAVAAVHRCGIVHADLKPDNVMLITDPSVATGFRVRLIDFDFSLLRERPVPWPEIVGTPGYLSPEHVRRQVPVPASDVFTCGVMLLQLLAGRHPCADSMDRYEGMALSGGLTAFALPRTIPGLGDSAGLSETLRACLHPDPDGRPTARELLEALNGWTDLGAPRRCERELAEPRLHGHLRIGAPGQPAEVVRAECWIDDPFLLTWYPERFPAPVGGRHFRVLRDASDRWTIEPCSGVEVRVDGNRLDSRQVLEPGRAVRAVVEGGRELLLQVDPIAGGASHGMLP